MKKLLLASAVALAMGATAASAATLEFVLNDYWAVHDNGFYVYNYTDYAFEAYVPTGSMDSGYNCYSYELDAGNYVFNLWDTFYLDCELLESCYSCDLGHGRYTHERVHFQVSEIPLPASAILLIGGLAGLGALRRRKN